MEEMQCERFGTMIDCSRNAVMNMETVKKWIDMTADMGYNSLMLYTEDTYEIDNNPYFGYGRGRYSKEEMKEIDRYALSKGMEVIPCIQTLAHLNAIFDWPKYKRIKDYDDILLVDNEETYELIDEMFKSVSECFTTKIVHVGMDEAHMVGRGKYYDLHGENDKTDILLKHVKRVAEIGKKYDLTLIMWSDMFFRIASGGEYRNYKFELSEEHKKLIPDNIELVYWDYYSKDKKVYDGMFKAHAKIKDNTWFAGGAWTWSGFAPCNKFSIDAAKAAMASCEKNKVKNIFITLWGDDSSECSKFSALPSLFYTSELVKGNKSLMSIKKKFKEKYGVSFDGFMNLDLTSHGRTINPSKYILFNDLFNGRFDTIITENQKDEHKKISRKLALLKNNKDWGYIFNTLKSLCDVVTLKSDLGLRIREAYDDKDMEKMELVISDCKKLKKLMNIFYNNFEKQWMIENKSTGFDVQDIRVGGMIIRIEHCIKRLEKLVKGEITKIDELEEKLLDVSGEAENYIKADVSVSSFRFIFTPNRLSW